MGSFKQKKRFFFSISSSHRETASKFFYEIEIVWFSDITTDVL